jgi:rhodanese-related sulfurtransferase
MRWKQFLTPVKNMTTQEAKSFIEGHNEGDYTLLDVRQKKEYEKARIPGSLLIPIPDLTNRLMELDPEKPIIVY